MIIMIIYCAYLYLMLEKMINYKYNIFIVLQLFVSMNFITLMNTILLTSS